MTGEPDELAVALDEAVPLRLNKLSQVTLLEAKCCLDNIPDLASQYESLEQFIRDGNNLGYVLDERGQGMPCFEERFRRIGAGKLHPAGSRAGFLQNIGCYDFIPAAQKWNATGGILQTKLLAHLNGPAAEILIPTHTALRN
jgi:hypothetical protein